jgi:hypothetical protein
MAGSDRRAQEYQDQPAHDGDGPRERLLQMGATRPKGQAPGRESVGGLPIRKHCRTWWTADPVRPRGLPSDLFPGRAQLQGGIT